MEFTLRAIVLGAVLAVVLSAANVYLGLKVGMTVSASIPAAVMAFAILRWFRNSHARENNLVQTAASAGEALAAGMIFTIPALILLDAWQTIDYLQTTLLISLGGIIGVLIAIPLRQALLAHPDLTFPEGVATAKVLLIGERQSSSVRTLFVAGISAAIIKLFQTGLGLLAGNWHGTLAFHRGIAGFGIDFSPALVAVGYIVGFRVALLMFAGGVFVWAVAMPIYSGWWSSDLHAASVENTFELWSEKLRFIGVGAMLVGGLWVLIVTLKPVWAAVYRALLSSSRQHDHAFSMRTTLLLIGLLGIPLGLVQYWLVGDVLLTVVAVVFAIIASFLFSTVAAYMAGLVGSSNNPVSGVTIATIFIAAWLVLFVSGGHDYFSQPGQSPIMAATLTILIGATVCCAAAISGDTMQDLKAGQILNASPRYQTWMQLLGVVISGVILIPVLELLYEAYGIAGHMPRAGMDVSQALTAPQASLMKSVTLGVFSRQMEWPLMITGMLIGGMVIAIDGVLRHKASSFRIPVMAVAVGMYLPVSLTTAIFVGGMVSHMLAGRLQRSSDAPVLYASGLIAGEALMGILLAVPFAIWQSTSILYLFDELPAGLLTAMGVIVIVYVSYGLWKSSEVANT